MKLNTKENLTYLNSARGTPQGRKRTRKSDPPRVAGREGTAGLGSQTVRIR